MRAVVAANYGSPDVLRIAAVPKPTPEADEVLIRVSASTVGPAESAAREGKPFVVRFFSGLRRPNAIPGDVLAGEIEAVGADVTRFAVGDRVFGTTAPETGAHAEYVCLPEDGALAVMPSGASYAEAAAVGDGGLTAMGFLRGAADVRPGQSVLVNGASGAIGTAAVQLAKTFGARVTGVCGTRNVELVQSLGADAVVDYTVTDFTETGEQYDVIFDAVGKSSYSRCAGSLTRDGVYLTTVPSAAILLQMGRTKLFGPKKAAFAATGLSAPGKKRDSLRFLGERVEAGDLRPVIGRRYPLEAVGDAHRYVDTGHKRGSAVLTVDA
jgi:NADPH:quinone reductase-like Zn-dependent oxidoreductase